MILSRPSQISRASAEQGTVRASSVSLVDRSGSVVQDWPRDHRLPEVYATTWLEWSPDGRHLAAIGPAGETAQRATRYGLFVYEVGEDAPDGPVFVADAAPVVHLSWSRRDDEELFFQSDDRRHVVDVGTGAVRDVSDTVPCCERIDSLGDGRSLGFGANRLGRRRELIVTEWDGTTTRRLAFARPPDPDGPVMSVCRGTYFTDKRTSADGRWVAFSASSAYGPRCDSPTF